MAGGSAVHFYVPAAAPAVKCGSEGMKTEFPPKMAAGECLTVFGVTEPTAAVDTCDWPDQDDRSQWSRLRELIAAAVVRRTRGEWEQVYRGTDIDLRWAASELRPAAASI